MTSKIQMVDLQGQYHRHKSEFDQALQSVIDRAAFINGEEVGLFAQELAQYLNVKHCIPCANGTDALQIALMALDLPPGAEVLVPTFNYVAAAEAIAFLGLTPVFVEAEAPYFNLSVSDLAQRVTPRTKAIVAVHLFGQCCDMEAIMRLANDHQLYVIEDNAQSIGAVYTFSDGSRRHAGTIGHIGTTSFFPSKNLSCMGDGGAITPNDDHLANKMQMIANHGQQTKYSYQIVGINSRLDTIQAAILRVKLRHFPDYLQARRQAADQYYRQLATQALGLPQIAPYSTHVFHQYTLTLPTTNQRQRLKDYLAAQGIPSMIYYPQPLHQQTAYSYLNTPHEQYPVANQLSATVLSLPIHTELSTAQTTLICHIIHQYFEQA
jgi:dTDP-4-amino-4,6-dideoxygalactose transaminase